MTFTEKDTATKTPTELLKELKKRAETMREGLPSDDAKKFLAWVEALKAMPDSDEDIVAEAEKKMESGHYLSDEATRATAEAIFDEMLPR